MAKKNTQATEAEPIAEPTAEPIAETLAQVMERELRAIVDVRETGQHIALTVKDGTIRFGLKDGTYYSHTGPETAQTFADVLKQLEASGLKVQDHPGRIGYALRKGAGVEIGRGSKEETVRADGAAKVSTPRKTGKLAAQVAAELEATRKQNELEATPEYWEKMVADTRQHIEQLTGKVTEYLINVDNTRKAQVQAVAREEQEAEAELTRLENAIAAQRAAILERKSRIATLTQQSAVNHAGIAVDLGLKSLVDA
jgi:hypothetical protein